MAEFKVDMAEIIRQLDEMGYDAGYEQAKTLFTTDGNIAQFWHGLIDGIREYL